MSEPAPGTRPFKIPESVLVIIHSADLQVLMIERADQPGYWQNVTGSKDTPDEALIETATREVGEETGIVIGSPAVPLANLRDWRLSNVYEIYPVWRHRYAEGVTRNTEHVFGLRVPRGVQITLSPREHLRQEQVPRRPVYTGCDDWISRTISPRLRMRCEAS